jgi:hypothetical protein
LQACMFNSRLQSATKRSMAKLCKNGCVI